MSRAAVVPAEPAFAPPVPDHPRHPTPDHPTACFAISAQPEPGTLLRVLEPFAKRGLVPSRCHAVCGGAGMIELVVDIQITGLDPALVELVAASLRQIVGVESVLTAEKRYALSA
jgi:acetolactate synthase regulatory subunit